MAEECDAEENVDFVGTGIEEGRGELIRRDVFRFPVGRTGLMGDFFEVRRWMRDSS